jgi:hypothetical protein
MHFSAAAWRAVGVSDLGGYFVEDLLINAVIDYLLIVVVIAVVALRRLFCWETLLNTFRLRRSSWSFTARLDSLFTIADSRTLFEQFSTQLPILGSAYIQW